MWLFQWALRQIAVTPMGAALGDYCEKIVNGSLTDTIDDYESFLQGMMEDNETGRYECAMRTMVFFKVLSYANDTPYSPY